MMNHKFSSDDNDDIDPMAMDFDDEEALADGMIPDSRIVKLIDELEMGEDDFDVAEESEIAMKSLGFDQYFE